MVITKLKGGLGNQLFQYALGRKLSLALGAELLIDTTLYGSGGVAVDGRSYGLSHFNIAAREATPAEIRAVGYPYGELIGRIQKRLRYAAVARNNHVKYEPSVLDKKGDVFLDGYWQSEKYFKDIRNILLKDFSLKKPFSPEAQIFAEKILAEPQSISLHVRRGDAFVNAEKIRVYGDHCNQDYYTKALAAVLKNGKESVTSHVFVFSDDIEWVKKNLDIPCAKTYIAENAVPDYESMMLMNLCRSHIIANSTFSWWGAWLDNKEGKVVVAPSIWTPGIDLPIDDILPPEWVRIPVKTSTQ